MVGHDGRLDAVAGEQLAGDARVLASQQIGAGDGVECADVMSPKLPIGVATT
jgi:hypothetical protein